MMTRIIPLLCLLASTAMANWPPVYLSRLQPILFRQPLPPPPFHVNERMKVLYNARDFAKLVKELYHEDAIVEVTKYGMRAQGHQQIEALLKNTAFGKIDEIKINSLTPNQGAVFVDALMTYSYVDGRKLQSRILEEIVNGKLRRFVQSHIEKF